MQLNVQVVKWVIFYLQITIVIHHVLQHQFFTININHNVHYVNLNVKHVYHLQSNVLHVHPIFITKIKILKNARQYVLIIIIKSFKII